MHRRSTGGLTEDSMVHDNVLPGAINRGLNPENNNKARLSIFVYRRFGERVG